MTVFSARNEGNIVESILSMVGIGGMADLVTLGAKLARAEFVVALIISVGVTTVNDRVS